MHTETADMTQTQTDCENVNETAAVYNADNIDQLTPHSTTSETATRAMMQLLEAHTKFHYSTPTKMLNFVKYLQLSGNMSAACRQAGVDRVTLWRHRKVSPELNQLIDEALDDYAEMTVEPAVMQRAVTGSPRKKFTNRGEPIIDPETDEQYVEYIPSPIEALAVLNARMSHKYRPQGNNTNITVNAAVIPMSRDESEDLHRRLFPGAVVEGECKEVVEP